MKKDMLYELLKLEYLNTNNGYIISDIVYIYGKYIVNLEHILTKSNISISFDNEYDLVNYLLYETYLIKLTDVIAMDDETVNYINDFKELDNFDSNYLKNHILYLTYKKFKKVKLSDEILINGELDDLEYDDNFNEPLDDINNFGKNNKYYVNSAVYGLNRGNNGNLLDFNLNYNLTYLDGYNIKNSKHLSNINFMIKDVEIFKYSKVYRINLDVLIFEDNNKIFSVKINNFHSFREEDLIDNIYRILDTNKESFKLQVHNKIKDLRFYKIKNEYNCKTLSYYDYKQILVEKILDLENIYLGLNDTVIDVKKCEDLLYEYIIRSDSSLVDLDVYREFLILSTGLNLKSYNNFLNMTKNIIDSYNERLEKLKNHKK